MALLGFIGTGNMGGALAKAASKAVDGSELLLCNRTAEKAAALAKEIGGTVTDAATVAASAKYIFLGVKPQMMRDVTDVIAPVLAARQDRFILVTMAAGLTMDGINQLLDGNYPMIRIMPNTPVSIGEGMILYCHNETATEDETEALLRILAASGRFSPLQEKLIDAGSSVCGCGPAFASMFLEALADGGVACGLPRKAAMEFAAQMMLGTAKLAMESGQHPGELKDAVCSPGGTTIQGVRKLEEGGFRAAVINAVIAAYEKNNDLR